MRLLKRKLNKDVACSNPEAKERNKKAAKKSLVRLRKERRKTK